MLIRKKTKQKTSRNEKRVKFVFDDTSEPSTPLFKEVKESKENVEFSKENEAVPSRRHKSILVGMGQNLQIPFESPPAIVQISENGQRDIFCKTLIKAQIQCHMTNNVTPKKTPFGKINKELKD